MFSYFSKITGPSLPYKLWSSAMADSPDGEGVLLFGGYNGSTNQDRILELRARANSWTIVNVTLKNRRAYHTVIPIA